MPYLRVYAFSSRTTPDGWDRREALQPAAVYNVDKRTLETPKLCVQGILARIAPHCRTLQLLGLEDDNPAIASAGVGVGVGVDASTTNTLISPFVGPLFGVPFEVDSLLLAAEPVGGTAACAANDARLSLQFVGWADGRSFVAARRDAILEPRWAALLFACASVVCKA